MTDRYAVIGNPVQHSKSPLIHNAFAAAAGQDLVYATIEAPVDGFARAVHAFRRGGGRGLNVTTPFKLDAFDIATERRPRAELAGAVNALKFEGGRIVAENFDGVGLVNDIRRNLGVALAGTRLLMLGAGGAARGALLPFIAQQPASIVVANRTAERARALAQDVAAYGNVIGCGYEAVGDRAFDVVINATSASLRNELPAVAPRVFDGAALAYELAYGKGLTPFLRMARDAGAAHVADGVGMLVEQAAEAFEWWRGIRPDTRPLIETLTVPLV